MVPQRADIVAGGKFLDDLDIGSEAGAGKHALEQIMAQQRGVRHPARKRCLERIDVIDSLAGIGAFTK